MKYTNEEVLERLRILGRTCSAKPFTAEEMAEFNQPPTVEELAEIEALRQATADDPWPLETDVLAIAFGLVKDPEGRVE